ncbi:hypothetical protein [Clostridium sp.]|uniref:hypothetical protein n=1 Tax=Clostridium sp. TaxID=1506 RepID=UPI003463B563
MIKKKFFITALTLLIISVFFNMYYMVKSTTLPTIYETNIYLDHVMLKDFSFIGYYNSIYVEKNSYLEKVERDQDINNISLSVSIDDDLIVSLSTRDTYWNDYKHYLDLQYPPRKLRLSKNSLLKVKATYTVNGENKESYKELQITDLTKM